MTLDHPSWRLCGSAPAPRRVGFRTVAGCAGVALVALLVPGAAGVAAQPRPDSGTVVSGRVTDLSSGLGLADAAVTIEGTALHTQTDPQGRYRLIGVPPGPQVVRVVRVGFGPARRPVVVPAAGSLTVDLEMAQQALALPNLIVTADPVGRARGELGTASVIDQEAIRNQTATSLYGILELIPGVVLQPPGLDGVQQISLRAVPSPGGSSPQGAAAAQPGSSALAAFGTQLVTVTDSA